MITIAFSNEKGGVGKTTTATTLGAELARLGHRVLIVDLDPQGHVSFMFGIKASNGIYSLVNGAPWQEILIPIHPDHYNQEQPLLFVVTGGDLTSRLLGSVPNLKGYFQQLSASFDYIVIDTSPSISSLHVATYLAADFIVYPTICDTLSVTAVKRSLTHLEEARQHYTAQKIAVAQVLGIVPTQFYGREMVQHQHLGKLQGLYGDDNIFSPIRRLATWQQAAAQRTSVVTYQPTSEAAHDALTFTQEVLAKLEALHATA